MPTQNGIVEKDDLPMTFLSQGNSNIRFSGESKLDRTLYLVVANDLATSQVELRLWEARVLDAAMALYTRHKAPVVRFRLADVLSVLGSKSRQPYRDADDIAKRLMQPNIRVEYTSTTGRSRWEYTQLVDKCSYDSGFFEIKFNREGLAMLDVERNYTSYSYLDANSSDSSYSNQFFKIITSKAYTGVYSDTLENFRTRLNIPDDKWQSYGHLKSRCIKSVLNDVNSLGAFTVTLEREHKQGRKVVGLEFSIKDHRMSKIVPTAAQADVEIDLSDAEIIKMLMTYRYERSTEDKDVIQMIRNNAESVGVSVNDYVQSNIDYAREREKTESQKVNGKATTGGFLIAALKKDYARRMRDQQHAHRAKLEQDALEKHADKEYALILDAHNQLFADVGDLIEDLSPTLKKDVVESVKKTLSPMKKYKSLVRDLTSIDDPRLFDNGIALSILKAYVAESLQQSKPDLYPDLESFAKSRNVSDAVMSRVKSGE